MQIPVSDWPAGLSREIATIDRASITANLEVRCPLTTPLRAWAATAIIRPMRFTSVSANRHVFDGQVSGRPLRLLLSFEDAEHLRLAVASDGYQMTVEYMPLDEPFNMGEHGSTIVEDVTLTLFPRLQNADVGSVRALQLDGHQVGVCIHLTANDQFNFWVDGDELWWGDEAALAAHDWPNKRVPTPAGRTYF